MKLTRRILHLKARPVKFDYPYQNDQLSRQLLKFMAENNGIGLAAPQVGIGQRVFVMKIGLRTWACFNPEIIKSQNDFTNYDEGCLSFPGESCTITRPDTIDVKYYLSDGTAVEEKLQGLASRCFQHELDHLDGIIMYDRKAENAVQS